MGDDRILSLARGALRVFLVGNIVAVVGFIGLTVLSFAFDDMLSAHLIAKYGHKVDVPQALLALRLLMTLMLPCGIAVHAVFANLLRIVATVRGGDPFTAANAVRLQAIGWALLAVQLCDVLLGGFTAWFAALHVDFAPWSPSLGGWIAVLMVFVLARVFRRGAAMRDDLAMTV